MISKKKEKTVIHSKEDGVIQSFCACSYIKGLAFEAGQLLFSDLHQSLGDVAANGTSITSS